jgi:hypothetical protein
MISQCLRGMYRSGSDGLEYVQRKGLRHHRRVRHHASGQFAFDVCEDAPQREHRQDVEPMSNEQTKT